MRCIAASSPLSFCGCWCNFFSPPPCSPPERETWIFSFQTIVDFVLILLGHALGLDHHSALLIFCENLLQQAKTEVTSDSASYAKLTPHVKYVLGWQLKSTWAIVSVQHSKQLGPSQPVHPQLFEKSTLHDVSWRPLKNCDSPGVVSVREVDCDGRVFIVFDGGTIAIHPLSSLTRSQSLRCRLRHTALVCRR